jgi:hypothetical protein
MDQPPSNMAHETEPFAPLQDSRSAIASTAFAVPVHRQSARLTTRKKVAAHRDAAPTLCNRARFHLQDEHRRKAVRSRAAEWN